MNEYDSSMKDVIMGIINNIDIDSNKLILHSKENVDIAPANISLAAINSSLEIAMYRETVLKRFIIYRVDKI